MLHIKHQAIETGNKEESNNLRRGVQFFYPYNWTLSARDYLTYLDEHTHLIATNFAMHKKEIEIKMSSLYSELTYCPICDLEYVGVS